MRRRHVLDLALGAVIGTWALLLLGILPGGMERRAEANTTNSCPPGTPYACVASQGACKLGVAGTTYQTCGGGGFGCTDGVGCPGKDVLGGPCYLVNYACR